MPSADPIHEALREFADAVRAKTAAQGRGQPEEQLRGPFETLLSRIGAAEGLSVVASGEAQLPAGLGRPDFAVHRDGLLTGYAELKAPGRGARKEHFRDRDREQFERFSSLPNVLYTDGNEWTLYRLGDLGGGVVRFAGNVAESGANAVSREDARSLASLLRMFLAWAPIIPTTASDDIDLGRFAEELAPLCRLLRDEAIDALGDPALPLERLRTEWRELLFPQASDAEFADAYAQTVTFAMLLGRSLGAEPLTLQSAQDALLSQHSLLSRALQLLTDGPVADALDTPLCLLRRLIGALPADSLSSTADRWLYFYEDFLAAYDPKLRKDAGVYYTPVEVVRAQVRLIDDLLVNSLGRRHGFADPTVSTLDPAAGTGTYLLGVIEHSLGRLAEEEGPGVTSGHASELARNLHGFERIVGAYAVAELRVSQALAGAGGELLPQGTRIYLTDTLESPRAKPPQLGLFYEPISVQRQRALEVKALEPVLVCLGNPPYDRHEAASPDNQAMTGAWVRHGEDGSDAPPLLEDFLAPAREGGHAGHLKNVYNLYVYFWRWALWKVFEHDTTSDGTGVVSFITASSYLEGDAFSGMREHMRRVCDELWILDLGGEGRGARQEENVFAIQTPVAIAVALRAGKPDPTVPAAVRYARIRGGRRDKLSRLDAIRSFGDVEWLDCPDGWQSPLRPAGKGTYFDWPLLTDLMPWQHSGIQLKRTWPIAPDRETLHARWTQLLRAPDRGRAFRETGDRKVDRRYEAAWSASADSTPLAELPVGAPTPPFRRYGYRSFDRQWILADTRLMSRPRPPLWQSDGPRQIYLTTMLSQPLGEGPAVTASASIPDLDHFRGSYGAKNAIPLYRTASASEPNLLPGLLERLGAAYGRPVTSERFAAYLYCLLAQPAFTRRFARELDSREVRVPITRDAGLFDRASAQGAHLLRLHTWGERLVSSGRPVKGVGDGKARCMKSVPATEGGYPRSFRYDEESQTLHVGEGEFRPVAPEAFRFEVSGLKVVWSWLGYRMRDGAGRKSSPLDDVRPRRWTNVMTTELLELLWLLEATLESYPHQEALLDEAVAGHCLSRSDLPPVPKEARRAPSVKEAANDLKEKRTSAQDLLFGRDTSGSTDSIET